MEKQEMEKTMAAPDKLIVGRVYSGAQVAAHFAAKTPSLPLLRFTNEYECHRNFSYKTGLNVDILPFSPRGGCAAGGLYFIATEHAHHHVCGHTYVRVVTLPDDARVYIEDCKMKADKFVLSERETITSSRMLFDAFDAVGRAFSIRFPPAFYTQQTYRNALEAGSQMLYTLKQDYNEEPRMALFDAAMLEKAAERGFVARNMPPEKLTRSLLMAAIRGKYSEGYLRKIFPPELFDNGVTTALAIASGNIAAVPPPERTAEVLDAHVVSRHFNWSNLALFDPALLTNAVYEKIATKKPRYVSDLPPSARTQTRQ